MEGVFATMPTMPDVSALFDWVPAPPLTGVDDQDWLPDGFEQAWTLSGPGISAPRLQAINSVCHYSPYIRTLIRRHPGVAVEALHAGQAGQTISVDNHEGNLDQAKTTLRVAKQKIALITALNDLFGITSVIQTTRHLSDFADAAINTALETAARCRGVPIAGRTGIVVLGMGKLGAQELNYSSDIDLIALYDPEGLGVPAQEARQVSIRIIQDMIAILHEQTPDGYVFRTDMRLRPDPGSSAVAVAIPTAEHYYENPRAQLGTGGIYQSTACSRRLSTRRAIPENVKTVCLEKIPRFRGDRRHTRNAPADCTLATR